MQKYNIAISLHEEPDTGCIENTVLEMQVVSTDSDHADRLAEVLGLLMNHDYMPKNSFYFGTAYQASTPENDN